MSQKTYLMVLPIVALFVGLFGGYYYGEYKGFSAGVVSGKETGRSELLAEQKKAQDDELSKVVEEANVFNDIENAANPFKDAYKNPFAQ
ncbi:MAG: hypothetical protein PHC85_00865 [Candidatus Pacebacteria bacterium]|nr:hypothetical protein [Candidatus Paceibacterota bacterium]